MQGSRRFGSERVVRLTGGAIHTSALGHGWQPENADTIWHMRQRLEEASTPGNMKRGPGGLVDIEFLVQMLQMKHAAGRPQLVEPNTLAALDALQTAGVLTHDDHEFFVTSYRFLRTIQLRLRLMSTTARDDLPDEPRELSKLAGLLRYSSSEALLADCQRYMSENRRRAERIFDVVAV